MSSAVAAAAAAASGEPAAARNSAVVPGARTSCQKLEPRSGSASFWRPAAGFWRLRRRRRHGSSSLLLCTLDGEVMTVSCRRSREGEMRCSGAVATRGRRSWPAARRGMMGTRRGGRRGRAGRTEVAAEETAAVGLNDAGEDFYSLLGVPPSASEKEIKQAYYTIMRDYHPDVSTDEEATDFCIFLNEIYETLSDPEKRAAYDEIAGFSTESINPFNDDTYKRDQAFVDEFTCIGCKNCCNVCPKTFGIEDMFGRARVMQQKGDEENKIQEAIDTCPVNCIHWVSAPQLSLLETEMMKIERVAVWVLMNGTSVAGDVFQSAYRAFEKRQAEIRARRNMKEQPSWMGFTEPNNNRDDEAADVRRRAAAASAAASARRWRDYQRAKSERDALYLPTAKG